MKIKIIQKSQFKIILRLICLKMLFFLLALFCFGLLNSKVFAAEGQVLGAHILTPHDLTNAQKLVKVSKAKDKDAWHYLTIPLTLADLEQLELWQDFFKQAKKNKFIPIVRLATKVKSGSWIRPTRYQVVKMFNFLNKLSWPTDKKYVIIFNEVNHAKEWGGKVDPVSYAQILEFAANWAHTEDKNYQILPAAMDLAAPNGVSTREAFTYLTQLRQHNPQIFTHIDVWNSHSYPNPGFSSSPERTTKNSLRGFQHELAYLKKNTNKDFAVMITETGWVTNRSTRAWLKSYYAYALQHVWSDPRIIAVTPFVVKGAPGPFADFSFFDENDQPTAQYQAYQQAVKQVYIEEHGKS